MIKSVNQKTIKDVFERKARFFYFTPKYQREYTWGYAEWSALYDDIRDNDEGYFIGSIIYINNSDSTRPRLELVDGQQRLTTICLFLAAIYSKFLERKEELDDDERVECSILKDSLRNEFSDNKLIVVPQEQGSNKADFSAVMNDLGLTDYAPHPNYYRLRKMWRCLQFFKERLEHDMGIEGGPAPIKVLMDTYNKLCQAVVVAIEVDSASDAYVLFESLNHRGVPLTAIDLIKNLVMAKAEKFGMNCNGCYERWRELLDDLTDNYASQERFFRQYYNAFKDRLNQPFRTEEDKKRDVLGIVATKSNLLHIYEKLVNKDLPAFLDDTGLCGRIYNQLLFPCEEKNKCALSRPLLDLAHIQGAPTYVLLLYLLRYRDSLALTDNMLSKIIDLLVVFFVRRNITDIPSTRDLTRIFMAITGGIEENKISGEAIYQYVHKTLAEVCAPDLLFKEKLEGDIYKDNVDAARFILCALSQKSMTKETWTDLWGRTESGIYVWTIEHIFPEGENIPQCWVEMIAGGDRQKADEYRQLYVHKLGNLTVTGYNSTLGNKSFEEKRDRKEKSKERYVGYRNGLEINRPIAEKSAWTVSDIKERTEQLVKEVMDMFAFPSATGNE